MFEDQLKQNKTYYTFSNDFENYTPVKKDKLCSNVTDQKRKLLPIAPITSEEKLKDLASIYTQIPTDCSKKIEAAKNFFSNIIKQIPPESYKIFNIEYDEENNINISETDEDD